MPDSPVPAPPRWRLDLVDEQGRPTEDVSAAAVGAVVELGEDGRPVRRTSFFLTREELPWLPVSEPAFLLWVLAALVAIWVVIALVITLT